MDERAYQHLADATFRRIEDALKDVDADQVDLDRAGDVITLTFKGGKKCIVNTQRPTRQIWLAANARAWHFDWDAAAGRWLDDKKQTNADGSPVELLGSLRRIVREASGVDVDALAP
jgi:CyaY protein